MKTKRAGFTMAEIVTVLAIVAVLAAVIIPQALRKISDAHSAALATDMDALAKAIEAYRGNMGRYPSSLTQLATAPVSGATDACGSAIPSQLLTQWRGPYINRTITSSGLPAGDTNIKATLARDPATIAGGNFGVLYIETENVDQGVANVVERAYDGGTPDLVTGNVRWNLVANGRGTLKFGVPIKGC